MTPPEAQRDYPYGRPSALLQVAPSMKWLRMSLPFALNHINLWLPEEEEMETDAGKQHGWRRRLRRRQPQRARHGRASSTRN